MSTSELLNVFAEEIRQMYFDDYEVKYITSYIWDEIELAGGDDTYNVEYDVTIFSQEVTEDEERSYVRYWEKCSVDVVIKTISKYNENTDEYEEIYNFTEYEKAS